MWLKMTVVRISLFILLDLGLSSSLAFCQELKPLLKNPEVVVSWNVRYGDAAEPMHVGDIYRLEESEAPSKSPGIILIHGGAWFAGDKTNDTQHAKRLAKMGFVVMSINYRLAPTHPFPAQIDDCNLALGWMVANADPLGVSIDALGAWGYSAGGHLAALMATNPKAGLPRLKATVVGAAPCDLTRIPADSQFLVGLLGGTRGKYPERYKDASPVTHVSPDDPPLFLFHGTKDWLVPPVSSELMRDALEKNHVSFEYLVVPKKAHLTTFIDHEATERSFLFLKEHLSAK